MKESKIFIWVKSILLPLIIGGAVGILISGAIDYESLNRPFLSPPSFLFPIVWTILYLIMGISYAKIKTTSNIDTFTNLVYYIQLFINALWSILFFILKWRLFSFLWILLLIVFVVLMIYQFYQKDKVAGLLQIPYLVWICFAAYLNLGVYLLN